MPSTLRTSRSPLPPTPGARLMGTVLLCSCCGRVEVRLEGTRFMLDPAELPFILDQLDDLEDRGGASLARRFLLGIGNPRVRLDLSWKQVEGLRLLLLAALDDIDRRDRAPSAPPPPSMN